MKLATLCFLLRDDEICLALKKVRFGAGKYNGFGGKVGDKPEFEDETIEEALVREGKEELDITIKDYKKAGEIAFVFPDKAEWGQIVHVFICKGWEGEAKESEEMRPEWFKLTEIPYEKMWDDDKYWLPKVLDGDFVRAKFKFNNEGEVISHEIRVLKITAERR